jgi:hypothetical protein
MILELRIIHDDSEILLEDLHGFFDSELIELDRNRE